MKFLITTIHNQHRWTHIPEHTTPILASDWRYFTYAGLTEKQAKHQSLTMAYQQIAQTAVFLGLDEYMVMEDDLKILDPLKLYESLENLPERFDIVYLTRTEHNRRSAKLSTHSEYFSRIVDNWWETPLTLWSGEFAKRFNNHCMEKVTQGIWLGHIDHELNKLNSGMHFGATSCTAVGYSTERQYAPEGMNFETAIS